LVWLFGKDHRGVVLENLALRQQLSIYKRNHKRPRFVDRDRWFWITLSMLWKDWRRAMVVANPDTVVRWQRERFRRYWSRLSKRPGIIGRPPTSLQIRRLIRTLVEANPLWRVPRIHGELLKLGIALSERTGVPSPANRQAGAVPDLEDILEEPRGRDGCRRLFHPAHDPVAGVIPVPGDRASAQAGFFILASPNIQHRSGRRSQVPLRLTFRKRLGHLKWTR
jgi:hypothetical protein